MTKAQITALLQSRLGNRTDAEFLARVDAELDMAQFELEHNGIFLPWFLQTFVVVMISTGVASLPTGYLADDEDVGFLLNNTDPLYRHDHAYLSARYKNFENQQPQAYAIVGGAVYFFPPPEKSYFGFYYIYKADILPSVISAGGTNAWMTNAADWLVAKAGVALARFIKDAEARVEFEKDLESAAHRHYTMHIDRAERNSPRKMGDV